MFKFIQFFNFIRLKMYVLLIIDSLSSKTIFFKRIIKLYLTKNSNVRKITLDIKKGIV